MFLSRGGRGAVVRETAARVGTGAIRTVLLGLLFTFSGSPHVPVRAQEGTQALDVDILLNFYGQDGDHSPVTGGIGTEQLTVLGAVVDLDYTANPLWHVDAELGLDSITSASTDNMDAGELFMSNASRNDQRVYGHVGVERSVGPHTFGVVLGGSGEFDYASFQAGLSYGLDLGHETTTLAARLNQYFDTVELYGIDGRRHGSDNRNTTTAASSFTQVLSRSAIATVSLEYTTQSGFLSTSFQEVILQPEPGFPLGRHVAERLPDQRERFAAGLQLNLAFTPNVVERAFYRYYDDDWGIGAHTIESETHFRLPTKREMWLFPILRFHTQTASDYYGPPGTFTNAEPYFTADGDLGGFDSKKGGLGWRYLLPGGGVGSGSIREIEFRGVYESREDGLQSFSTSIGFRWGF